MTRQLKTCSGTRLRTSGHKKTRSFGLRAREGRTLGLLDQAGLDGLDRDPHALGAAIGQLDLDPLQVRAEQAGRVLGDVGTNASALLGLTLAVDDLALGGAFTGDCANSCHGVS